VPRHTGYHILFRMSSPPSMHPLIHLKGAAFILYSPPHFHAATHIIPDHSRFVKPPLFFTITSVLLRAASPFLHRNFTCGGEDDTISSSFCQPPCIFIRRRRRLGPAVQSVQKHAAANSVAYLPPNVKPLLLVRLTAYSGGGSGRTFEPLTTPFHRWGTPLYHNERHLSTPPRSGPATSVYDRGSVQGGSGFSPRLAAPQSPAKPPPTLVFTHP